jgi:ATP-dependent Clp protease ATP-binding subunit ClpA
VIESYRPW